MPPSCFAANNPPRRAANRRLDLRSLRLRVAIGRFRCISVGRRISEITRPNFTRADESPPACSSRYSESDRHRGPSASALYRLRCGSAGHSLISSPIRPRRNARPRRGEDQKLRLAPMGDSPDAAYGWVLKITYIAGNTNVAELGIPRQK